jgi:hypothetical protein
MLLDTYGRMIRSCPRNSFPTEGTGLFDYNFGRSHFAFPRDDFAFPLTIHVS